MFFTKDGDKLLKICSVEYELDEFNMKILSREESNYFPRMYTFNERIRFLIKKIHIIFIPTLVFLVIIFNILMITFFLLKKLINKKNNIKTIDENIFIKWSSDKNLKYIDSLSTLVEIYPLSFSSKNNLTLLEFINKRDFFSFYIEYINTLKEYFVNKDNYNFPTSYTIFLYQLIITKKAIEKINCKIILLTNHYDRWIYLTDRFANDKIKLINVNHGDPVGRKQNGEFLVFQPTQKLINTWDIYCEKTIDSNSLSLLRSIKPYIYRFESSVNVIDDLTGCVLVILGNKRLYRIYKKIIEEIIKYDFKFYYRPHPLENNIPSSFNPYIDPSTGDNLTKTKILLSYGSSLDDVYQKKACKELIHIRDDGSNISQVLESIRRII